MFDQHQDSSPILARSGMGGMALAERQALWVVRDVGHFVTRSLAIVHTLTRHDLQMAFAAALAMIERDEFDELARLLGDLPALVDFRPNTEEGLMLLHAAARSGTPHCIALLIERGAAPDQPCGHRVNDTDDCLPGWTPLLIAARNRREENALELLAWGADPARADPQNGDTPLHYAASLGMEQLARHLIFANAPLDALATWRSFDDELGNYAGNTPLHLAALGNQLDIAWLLIKAGADRDAALEDQRSPLFYAAARGHSDVLEVLLAAGADPNTRESSIVGEIVTDLTPLHYAVLNGHSAAVAMLLCYGADPTLIERNSHATALDMARRNADLPILTLLATAAQQDFTEGVFSGMDDQMIAWQRRHFDEMRPFLENLLAERQVDSRGLLVLSDWLAEVLGAENRVHLARVYREWAATQALSAC